jgi:predicted permease
MGFTIVLGCVLSMMAFMAMGYAMAKAKLAKVEHSRTLSAFLVYCATPGMIISSFQTMYFTPEDGKKLLLFFLVSLAVQLIMYGAMVLILGKRLEKGKFRILTIGSFMGNVGFFGRPLVEALFPDQPIVACYSMMFATSMNLLIFTIGEFMISRDRKYITIKRAFINPTILAVMVAIPLYLLRIKLPSGIQSIMLTLREMSAPICMFVLGVRLASMDLKDVFGQPIAYLGSALKLIAFPLLAYAIVYFMPWFDSTFKITLLITTGTPCAAVMLSLAELHDCEQKNAACTLLVSTILCIITLPLLALLFT